MLPYFNPQRKIRENAQAIVEFAIVLPILLVLLVGILEVGRMLFIYAAANNASREAVRYASAWGLNDAGTAEKFNDCDGIRNMARRSAFFVNLNDNNQGSILIQYDDGPGTTIRDTCDGSIDDVTIASGDRAIVTVTVKYKPLINLIPIPARDFISTSARTVLGIVNLDTGVGSSSTGCTTGCIGATATNTPTNAPPTSTPTRTQTATSTSTPTFIPGGSNTNTPTPTGTATPTPGVVLTFTPTPTLTGSETPTSTMTSTATNTPTLIPTNTPTFTPTATSTPLSGCDQIATSVLAVNGSNMSMAITNPHDSATVASITVTWNWNAGSQTGALALKSASLNGTSFWTTGATTSPLTITPTALSIPGNNRISTILFSFDKAYKNSAGFSSITINLTGGACEGISIHNK